MGVYMRLYMGGSGAAMHSSLKYCLRTLLSENLTPQYKDDTLSTYTYILRIPMS